MKEPLKIKALIVGVGAIATVFAASWAVAGLFVAIFVWGWSLAIALLVLYLLRKDSRAAKIAAVLLEGNTIFLFFLPKHIRTGLEELKKRETKST